MLNYTDIIDSLYKFELSLSWIFLFKYWNTAQILLFIKCQWFFFFHSLPYEVKTASGLDSAEYDGIVLVSKKVPEDTAFPESIRKLLQDQSKVLYLSVKKFFFLWLFK